MAGARISVAESAVGDLQEIAAWYEEQGVPEVGHRLISEILQQIEVLASHPEMGRVAPEFEQPDLRELILPPFRIVYRHETKPRTARVRIIRVWRSERLLRIPPS